MADDLDYVQHPTLGTLKFPKDMPQEERDASIDFAIRKKYNLPAGTDLRQKEVPAGVDKNAYTNAAYEASAMPKRAAQGVPKAEPPRERGYWAGLKSSTGLDRLPDAGTMFDEAVMGGIPAIGAFRGLWAGAKAAARPTEELPENMRSPVRQAIYRGASFVAPSVGISPESMEERARAGDTAGILGEATIPTAAALLGARAAMKGRAPVETRTPPVERIERVGAGGGPLPRTGGEPPRPAGPEAPLTGGEPMSERIPPTTERPRPVLPPRPRPGAPTTQIKPVAPLGGISAAGTEAATRAGTPEQVRMSLGAETDDLRARLGGASPQDQAVLNERIRQNEEMMREGGGGLPPAPPTQQITPVSEAPKFTRKTEGGADWAISPEGKYRVSVTPGMSEADINAKLQEQQTLHQQLQQRLAQPGTPERPPPAEETDPLKREFPDPAVRKFVRANGPELVRAAEGDPDALEAVHRLSNVQIRQAALNAGIELGTKHVGQRIGLGPEQISRQELIAQMLREGNSPRDIVRLAETEQVPYQKTMPIPKRLTRPEEGLTATAILRHELGHAIIGLMNGFEQFGIASHRFARTAYRGASASTMFNFKGFRNPVTRGFDIKAMGDRVEGFSDMLAAGAAANELVDGVHRETNPGLYGDKQMASQLFDAMGIPREKHVEYWNAAVDRALEKLRQGRIADIIREESLRREENLPGDYHFSRARVQHIHDLVERSLSGETEPSGVATRIAEEGGAGREAPPAAAEAAAAEQARGVSAPAEKLKPFRLPKTKFYMLISGEGVPSKDIIIEANRAREAFKTAQKQNPGYNSFEITQFAAPEVQSVYAKTEPRGSTVPLWQRPLRFGARPTVGELAGRLGRLAGKPISAAENPELAMKRAMRLGESELDFQRKRENSGEDWYNADMKAYDDALRAHHPDIAKSDARLTIAKAMQAGLSLGNKTVPAIKNTLTAISEWRKTGEIPLNNPATGRPWPNGQFNAYMSGFRTLQRLIADKREAGAAKWLIEQHPISELREYRSGVPGKATDLQHGALVLGDKAGPFFLNMMGIDARLTADLWFSRTWNRYLATPFEKAMAKGKRIERLIDAPRSTSERILMEDFVRTLAERKGLELKQVQAILWNYEQALYKLHGIESTQPSYGQAARALVEERVRPANAGRAGRSQAPRETAVAGRSRGRSP